MTMKINRVTIGWLFSLVTIAGLTATANAQCGGDCPPSGTRHTLLSDSQRFDVVPPATVWLSYDEFDPVAVAANHGVPPAQIQLKGAAVGFYMIATGQLALHNVGSVPCSATWSRTVTAHINGSTDGKWPNMTLHASDVDSTTLDPFPSDPCPPPSHLWDFVGNFHYQQSDSHCNDQPGLWIGNAIGMIKADVDGTFTLNDSCEDLCVSHGVFVEVGFSVTYEYCVLPLTAPCGFGLEPASLLIYPEFDNRPGTLTLLSITNTAAHGSGDIDAEFVYVRRFDAEGGDLDCAEFNTTELLTPKDNFSAITIAHFPFKERGYVYAFAKDRDTGQPIVHNHLIGSLRIIDGLQSLEWATRPFAYQGIEDGDVNGNGLRDLDGVEYQMSPDVIMIPRFLGTTRELQEELLLINLTGGAAFETEIDLLAYNDNESTYSTSYEFYCWDRVPLQDISPLFSQTVMKSDPSNDPDEIFGAPQMEAGWFELEGDRAWSTLTTIDDPAVLALLVERSRIGASATLPFATGENPNGKLLATDPAGQGNP